MKITIYIRPGTDTSSYARSIKSMVEEETGQLCIVKISEDRFKPVRIGDSNK